MWAVTGCYILLLFLFEDFFKSELLCFNISKNMISLDGFADLTHKFQQNNIENPLQVHVVRQDRT